MHLTVGQRWEHLHPGSIIQNKILIVEIIEILGDKINNPDYPNCSSAMVKVLQIDEASARIGVYFIGFIHQTNFLPIYATENKFWKLLPGQEAPQE